MTAQTVYLIRHGQVDGNVLQLHRRITVETFNEIVAHVAQEEINEAGSAQVRSIAPQIARLNLKCLYTSPLPRAKRTADILAAETGLPVLVRDDLYELLPAHLPFDLHRTFTMRGAYLRSGLRLITPWTRDTETVYAAYRRVRRAWQALTEETHEDFGIVGHQGIFRILFVWIHASRRWRLVKGDTSNTGISIVARQN